MGVNLAAIVVDRGRRSARSNLDCADVFVADGDLDRAAVGALPGGDLGVSLGAANQPVVSGDFDHCRVGAGQLDRRWTRRGDAQFGNLADRHLDRFRRDDQRADRAGGNHAETCGSRQGAVVERG